MGKKKEKFDKDYTDMSYMEQGNLLEDYLDSLDKKIESMKKESEVISPRNLKEPELEVVPREERRKAEEDRHVLRKAEEPIVREDKHKVVRELAQEEKEVLTDLKPEKETVLDTVPVKKAEEKKPEPQKPQGKKENKPKQNQEKKPNRFNRVADEDGIVYKDPNDEGPINSVLKGDLASLLAASLPDGEEVKLAEEEQSKEDMEQIMKDAGLLPEKEERDAYAEYIADLTEAEGEKETGDTLDSIYEIAGMEWNNWGLVIKDPWHMYMSHATISTYCLKDDVIDPSYFETEEFQNILGFLPMAVAFLATPVLVLKPGSPNAEDLVTFMKHTVDLDYKHMIFLKKKPDGVDTADQDYLFFYYVSSKSEEVLNTLVEWGKENSYIIDFLYSIFSLVFDYRICPWGQVSDVDDLIESYESDEDDVSLAVELLMEDERVTTTNEEHRTVAEFMEEYALDYNNVMDCFEKCLDALREARTPLSDEDEEDGEPEAEEAEDEIEEVEDMSSSLVVPVIK